MSENSKKVNSVEKKGGFKALKNEFKKIMWPDKQTVINKTIAVVVICTLLAIIIASIDVVLDLGLTKILG